MGDADGQRRVLIVEDSPVMRGLLRSAVGIFESIAVDEAPDGAAALKAIRTADQPYDVVLLDLNLPILDGMKLLGYLQREQLAGASFVCVVTTEGSPDTEVRARGLGAGAFLRKPVTVRDLRDVLRDRLT